MFSNNVKIIAWIFLVLIVGFAAGFYVSKNISDKNAQNMVQEAVVRAIKSYKENPLNKIPPLKSLNGTVAEIGKDSFSMEVLNILGIEVHPRFRTRIVLFDNETVFNELKIPAPVSGSDSKQPQKQKIEKIPATIRMLAVGARVTVVSVADIQGAGAFLAKEVLFFPPVERTQKQK